MSKKLVDRSISPDIPRVYVTQSVSSPPHWRAPRVSALHFILYWSCESFVLRFLTWQQQPSPYTSLSNEEILGLINSGKLSVYTLESSLGDSKRAVEIRRQHVIQSVSIEGRRKAGNPALEKLPWDQFDVTSFYNSVDGTNCEAVIGFVVPFRH